MIVENAEYQAPPAAADGFLRFARATGLAEQIEAAAVRGKKVGRTMLVALASPIENRQGREHGRSIPFCDSPARLLKDDLYPTVHLPLLLC